MATATKDKKEASASRVCVLETSIGEPLIVRANPSKDDVRGFVGEHLRRYHAGEDGGPGGHPPHKILTATYYESELAFHEGDGKQEEVDISDLDPMAR